MSNRFPLQSGDVAPDLSGHQFSTEADRRSPAVGANNAAPQQDRPEGRLWKVGQATPNEFLSAPFPVIETDGDANGMPGEVHEIDIYSYGDGYDPTAPIRVRQVAPPEQHWSLDSDFDGHRN